MDDYEEPCVLAWSKIPDNLKSTMHDEEFDRNCPYSLRLFRLINLHPGCKTFFKILLNHVNELSLEEKKKLIGEFNKEFNICQKI